GGGGFSAFIYEGAHAAAATILCALRGARFLRVCCARCSLNATDVAAALVFLRGGFCFLDDSFFSVACLRADCYGQRLDCNRTSAGPDVLPDGMLSCRAAICYCRSPKRGIVAPGRFSWMQLLEQVLWLHGDHWAHETHVLFLQFLQKGGLGQVSRCLKHLLGDADFQRHDGSGSPFSTTGELFGVAFEAFQRLVERALFWVQSVAAHTGAATAAADAADAADDTNNDAESGAGCSDGGSDGRGGGGGGGSGGGGIASVTAAKAAYDSAAAMVSQWSSLDVAAVALFAHMCGLARFLNARALVCLRSSGHHHRHTRVGCDGGGGGGSIGGGSGIGGGIGCIGGGSGIGGGIGCIGDGIGDIGGIGGMGGSSGYTAAGGQPWLFVEDGRYSASQLLQAIPRALFRLVQLDKKVAFVMAENVYVETLRGVVPRLATAAKGAPDAGASVDGGDGGGDGGPYFLLANPLSWLGRHLLSWAQCLVGLEGELARMRGATVARLSIALVHMALLRGDWTEACEICAQLLNDLDDLLRRGGGSGGEDVCIGRAVTAFAGDLFWIVASDCHRSLPGGGGGGSSGGGVGGPHYSCAVLVRNESVFRLLDALAEKALGDIARDDMQFFVSEAAGAFSDAVEAFAALVGYEDEMAAAAQAAQAAQAAATAQMAHGTAQMAHGAVERLAAQEKGDGAVGDGGASGEANDNGGDEGDGANRGGGVAATTMTTSDSASRMEEEANTPAAEPAPSGALPATAAVRDVAPDAPPPETAAAADTGGCGDGEGHGTSGGGSSCKRRKAALSHGDEIAAAFANLDAAMRWLFLFGARADYREGMCDFCSPSFEQLRRLAAGRDDNYGKIAEGVLSYTQRTSPLRAALAAAAAAADWVRDDGEREAVATGAAAAEAAAAAREAAASVAIGGEPAWGPPCAPPGMEEETA
ncbi:unnamed protein product, partial [Phaeothamnion confervicola]